MKSIQDLSSDDLIEGENFESSERDISLHLATVGLVGILGIIIGKYSHQMLK